MNNDLAFMTASEMVARFRAKSLSPVEATDQALARIERFEPTLNAFQHLDPDSARAAATASEARWAKGEPRGALDGVPTTIKDLTPAKGWPTLGGSLTTDPDQAWDQDAPATARLREAGAVLLGKTTTPEFGWKGITDSGPKGITRNPWNPTHSPGGSSGGAAAALAAGIGAIAHGTDGGGSIRIPASFSGLFGIKPTFGRVSDAPNTSPYATLTSSGPLARTVGDAALMLNELARPDVRDWYAAEYRDVDWRNGLDGGVAGLRLAYCPDLGGAEPKAEVEALVAAAAQAFTDLGATVEQPGPVFDPLRPIFETSWKAGFTHRVSSVPTDKRHLIDPGLRVLAEEGEATTLGDYYAGMTARAELGVTMSRFHETFDLLLTPTTPAAAPAADTIYHTEGYDRWRHAVPYTVPFNLTGQPSASIPCGVTRAGLPVGLQITGPRFAEALILRAARAYETTQPFPHPHPLLEASLAAIGNYEDSIFN
ncbi:MAG: amidase [Pseudomonadota bacterium]|nr:amidase [Pseudomonadota bacterium]